MEQTTGKKKTLQRPEYDVLVSLADAARKKQTGKPQSTPGTSRTIKALEEKQYIKNGVITRKGLRALEPYRVKRAVFIAAGFGARLVPVTLNTPKPLVRVNGKRMIDTLLDAVLEAGIKEIYIVRGYLAEQFDQLLYRYPMIRFIENPVYNEENNISSAIRASAHFKNAYVMESDLVLHNPSLLTPYQYASNYLGYPVKRTDDWCFEVKDGVIRKPRVGGVNCYHWLGVCYLDEADGKRLPGHLKKMHDSPGGKEKLWDMAALEMFQKEYRFELRTCRKEDITEIDTFRELQELDPAYRIKGSI